MVGRLFGMRFSMRCFACGSAVEIRIVRSNGNFCAMTSLSVSTAMRAA